MNTRKWLIAGGVTTLVFLATLALATGLTRAQELEPGTESNGDAEVGEAAAVINAIPIQGRLTDAGGNPIDGSRTITFTLYDRSSGGTVLCQDEDSVNVDNGLFSGFIDYCTSSDIDGKQLYLGIQVEGDEEMTPRRGIYPVPYAFSLRPGAVISDTHDGILTVRSTGSGDGDALFAYAGDEGEGVTATSVNGVGVAAFSDNYLGLQAYSYETSDHPGIFGCSAASNSTCDPYRDDGAAGVMGYGQTGVHGIGTYYGVYARTTGSSGYAGYFANGAGGVALGANSVNAANGDDIVRFQNNLDIKFKVEGDGDVYIDGTYYDTGADFAEMLPAQDGLQPGDVLIIGTDGQLTRSTGPYQTAVVGVYSTRPGFVGGVGDDDLTGKVPLAIVGIVPVKASAENGAIRPGDLLVTASSPGHAMRAGDNPPQGTILGKALGELEDGTGVIQLLVTLQ
jgi:hypothetical protein